jgi:hypothetical protein
MKTKATGILFAISLLASAAHAHSTKKENQFLFAIVALNQASNESAKNKTIDKKDPRYKALERSLAQQRAQNRKRKKHDLQQPMGK